TIINKKDKNDSESIKEIVYNRREKAKNHFYCDGRKATPKKTDSTENDELDFWWCANKKCYKPSRQLHTADEWKNYTLLDFLSILKIEYNLYDYEILVGLINKANRFFEHLKCREC